MLEANQIFKSGPFGCAGYAASHCVAFDSLKVLMDSSLDSASMGQVKELYSVASDLLNLAHERYLEDAEGAEDGDMSSDEEDELLAVAGDKWLAEGGAVVDDSDWVS